MDHFWIVDRRVWVKETQTLVRVGYREGQFVNLKKFFLAILKVFHLSYVLIINDTHG